MEEIPYVNLFGYNTTVEGISPVVIAVANAGISQQKKSFEELRKKYMDEKELKNLAEKLKKDHHDSVKEHIYLNFDVICSRLLAEFLEMHRIGTAYTEKSQRFTTAEDYFIPDSLKNDEIISLVSEQFDAYKEALSRNVPKQDARYVLPLLTLTKIEFSCNGRALEYIIQKAKSSEIKEIKLFGEKLEKEVKKEDPSIEYLLDFEAKEYYSKNEELERYISMLVSREKVTQEATTEEKIVVEVNDELDNSIIAATLFSKSVIPYEKCWEIVRNMSEKEKKELVKKILEPVNMYGKVPRTFEDSWIRINAVVSASCFAQLKRHRMLTLIPQSYDPYIELTIPESIEKAGLKDKYKSLMEKASEIYIKLKEQGNPEAPYILTNGHGRRVLLLMNLRELYEIARLRLDKKAQLEIREFFTEVVEEVRKKAPLTSLLLCGRHEFDERKAALFQKC